VEVREQEEDEGSPNTAAAPDPTTALRGDSAVMVYSQSKDAMVHNSHAKGRFNRSNNPALTRKPAHASDAAPLPSAATDDATVFAIGFTVYSMRNEPCTTWNIPKLSALNLLVPLPDRLGSEIIFRDVQLHILYQSMLYNNKIQCTSKD
jgi:hypothetical protein